MARTWGTGRRLPKSSPIGQQNKTLVEDPTAPDGVAWGSAGTADGLVAASNLSDLDDASEARNNLGLGTAATSDSTDFASSGAGDADNAPYTPAVTGNWTGADPTTVAQALDRLAAACVAASHTP